MAINIELKAQVDDFSSILAKLINCKKEFLRQEDVYFNHNTGRLKLRNNNNEALQIIFYNREDKFGASVSEFKVHTYKNQHEFSYAYRNFKNKYGIRAIVKKKRIYCRYNDFRIHLDEIENIGKFVEIEFICNNIAIEKAKNEAETFFYDYLQIPHNATLDSSYVDIILKEQCII